MTTRNAGRQQADGLEMSRKVAFIFTIIVAVAAGVTEIVRQTAKKPVPGWLPTTANALDVCLAVGGVLMGLLYLLHLTTGRKSS